MTNERPTVTVGVNPVFAGISDTSVPHRRIGSTWISSDAALITCRVRRDGVRCHHWRGPGFFIGFERGERTF